MLSDEEISKYNVLIGHTPFSFFRDFSHPVVIFDYYKNYALKLINDVCSRINQVFETSFDYLVNPEAVPMRLHPHPGGNFRTDPLGKRAGQALLHQ